MLALMCGSLHHSSHFRHTVAARLLWSICDHLFRWDFTTPVIWPPFQWSYFTFLPEIDSAGFPACEFAVAETFGFSCFGFLVSFLLFLPLAIVCPFNMQQSGA
jgi:hypothetical protein